MALLFKPGMKKEKGSPGGFLFHITHCQFERLHKVVGQALQAGL
jgi:hypothetical protein